MHLRLFIKIIISPPFVRVNLWSDDVKSPSTETLALSGEISGQIRAANLFLITWDLRHRIICAIKTLMFSPSQYQSLKHLIWKISLHVSPLCMCSNIRKSLMLHAMSKGCQIGRKNFSILNHDWDAGFHYIKGRTINKKKQPLIQCYENHVIFLRNELFTSIK
jgi:hypothetical protein